MSAPQLTCPSCGTPQSVNNPGILTVVCESCQTTLYREDEALFAGSRSIVGEPRSTLSVGETGKVGERTVSLVGRVRFEGDSSTWDEWYGTDDTGRDVWLVEDARRYTLERALGKPVPGAHPDMSLGDELTLGSRRYQVDEVGEATCKGGEGQLPRGIRPGEVYRFIDLTEIDGTARLTLEFGAGGSAEAFVGRDVPAEAVRFKGGAAPSPLDTTQEARSLSCPNCGGGFELPKQGEPALTATCPYCDSILSLEGAAAVISKNSRKLRMPLEIGDKGKLLGRDYEVIGRMAYKDQTGWPSREYLLWGEKSGYLWLEEESGNYIAYKPTSQGPSLKQARSLLPKQKMTIAGKQYTYFGLSRSTLHYVDGALPWLAKVGDSQRSMEFIAPPMAYSIELTGDKEMERFTGQHVEARTVYDAFKRSDRYQAPSEAGIATPNPVTGAWWTAALMMLAFAGVNVVLAIGTMATGTEVARVQLSAGQQSAESQPFSLTGDEKVMSVRVSTQTDNSWVYVETELIDEASDGLMGATASEVSYYHGYEGGESWSEGSKSETNYFKPPPAGSYSLAVEAEWDRSTPVTVSLRVGEKLGRYPLILAVLMGLGPLFIGLRWRAFERDRWDEDEED